MDRLELYARMSREAYRVLTCDADATARFEAVESWLPGITSMRSTEQGSGAFCVNLPGKLILAFRGTQTPKDMFLDAECVPELFVAPGGSWDVHGGFLACPAVLAMAPWVRSVPAVALRESSTRLSVATAWVARLQRWQPWSSNASDAYTLWFPPGVLRPGVRRRLRHAPGRPETSRIVHAVDLVPRLPGVLYRHVCQGEWITTDGHWTQAPSILACDLSGLWMALPSTPTTWTSTCRPVRNWQRVTPPLPLSYPMRQLIAILALFALICASAPGVETSTQLNYQVGQSGITWLNQAKQLTLSATEQNVVVQVTAGYPVYVQFAPPASSTNSWTYSTVTSDSTKTTAVAAGQNLILKFSGTTTVYLVSTSGVTISISCLDYTQRSN